MSTPSNPIVARARALFQAGRLRDAERALLDAMGTEQRDLVVLNALASLYLETGRLPECSRALMRVIELDPLAVESYHTLAGVLNQLGRYTELTELYARLVANRPNDGLAHFNLACCLRREGHLEKALAMHERAVALGLEGAEEAWTNIGVLRGELNRHDDARAAFETALALNPRWIPALYNLALWHEEHADPTSAIASFERVLAIDPDYHNAVVRLAHVKKLERRDDPLFAALEGQLERTNISVAARESVHFALGKALDDCSRFDEAWAQFVAANSARPRSYDRAHAEALIDRILSTFPRGWSCSAASDAPLVFACGMYRSGSTLLEQMIGAHPNFVAGGEIGYFRSRIMKDANWPETFSAAPQEALDALGRGYLELLARTFPGTRIIVDKQPDNFLALGLLRSLFPNACFVHTARDPRDIALSVYCQQFDDSLPWSRDLDDIAHQLSQRDRLLEHWRQVLGDRLLEVQYENLVADAPGELRRVCHFLDAEWRDEMLSFHERGSRVRTASVWQVRQPLHQASIGRWKNYAPYSSALSAMG